MKVVDASLALKLVVEEEGSTEARALWAKWKHGRELLLAPVLFRAETTSSLRRAVHRGRLSSQAGEEAFTTLRALPIRTVDQPGLYERAWLLSKQLNRPGIYDCLYLALAESLDCDLWTADDRLWRVAHPQFPRVHTLGDFEAGSPGEMSPVR